MQHPATKLKAAETAFPLLWCPSCAECVEPENHTRASLDKAGAEWLFVDQPSGCDVYRINGHLLATNTDYCPCCETILSDFDPRDAWLEAGCPEGDDGLSYVEQVRGDFRAAQGCL